MRLSSSLVFHYQQLAYRKLFLKSICFVCVVLLVTTFSSRETYAIEPTNTRIHPELKDITILIPSCDKYSELWDATIKLLFKEWPDLLEKYNYVPLYLISNSLNFDNPRVTNIKITDEKTWSDNLIQALSQVKTKYVLIFLDDYIVASPVNTKRLLETIDLMDNTNAAYIQLAANKSLADGNEVKSIKGVSTRSQTGQYRTSLQTCLWRTEVLMQLLKPGESAWDFEIKGTKRSEKITLPFYVLTEDPVFNYYNALEKGKYRKEAIDYMISKGIHFQPVKPFLE
jgi:hypothetical protein